MDADQLVYVEQELASERRALAVSERADCEGRVTDHGVWLESMRRRRERIALLARQEQQIRDDLVAEEESAAELADEHRAEALA